MVKVFRWRDRHNRPHGAERSMDRGGYGGLEGDFESERRRAMSASHEASETYEHGEGEAPVLPSTTAGMTHP